MDEPDIKGERCLNYVRLKINKMEKETPLHPNVLFAQIVELEGDCAKVITRLLPNRSPVAWGSQRIALGALIFHSNTFHFICWAPKFSAFSSEGPFKIFLGSSLESQSLDLSLQTDSAKKKRELCKTNKLCKTNHEQCIFTSNRQL